MKTCPICELEYRDEMLKCNCGYKFDSNEIEGIVTIPKDLDWFKDILIKKRVLELYRSKGKSLTDVAKSKFKKSKATLSMDIALAEALNKYPELKKCKTKGEARKILKFREIAPHDRPILSDFKKESELRDFLRDTWERIILSAEWLLKGCEYPTKEVGNIDLLARHKKEKKWLVIELKLLQGSDETIGQLLRYIGWVKEHLANEKEEVVEGLIIAKYVDLGLYYASLCMPDIRLKVYSFENNELKFKDYNYKEDLINQIAEMAPEEFEGLIEKITRKRLKTK